MSKVINVCVGCVLSMRRVRRDQRHGLYMRSHREHVDGLDFLGFVAELLEDGEVAGEAGGVAGNVDDAVGVHVGEGLEDRLGAAGARRVDDDDIGAHALLVEARHDLGRVTDNEFGVADVVVARVLLRIEDGGLDDLDAVDLAGFLREEQRDRAGATVGVDDGLLALEVRELQRLVVEDFGLLRVDLEEGARRDVEGQAADTVEDGRLAPEQVRLAAHDDVVAVRLDVLVDADDVRQALAQGFDEFLLARQLLRGRDDDDHELALLADAADDMAQHARVAVLIVDGDAQLCDDIAHGIDDLVVALFLDVAVARVDDLVRALRKAADDGLALAAANRELHLIAIVPRALRAERRLDEEVLLAADARDGVDDLLALGLELGHVVEVLELAAAALLVDGTDWRDAVAARAQDLDEMASGVRLLDLVHGGLDGLARQRTRHKYRKFFVAPYALAARAERADLDLI